MAKFRRKPFVIEATRVTEATEIETANGWVTAQPGDWLLLDSLGKHYPCNDVVFRMVYEPADAEAEKLLETP